MHPHPNPDSEETAPGDERRWQTLLREHGTDYVEDAGFTATVLGRLPASRRFRARRRSWLLALATAAGVAAAGAGGWDAVGNGAEAWRTLLAWSASPVPYCGEVLSLGSLLVLAAGLAVGWRAYAREN